MKNMEWYGDKVISSVKNAKRGGLTAASEIVEGSAKLLLSGMVDTGNLMGSINYKVVSEDEAHVGTNVKYAPYVEFGTGRHAEGGGGRSTPWVYYHPKYGFVKTEGMPPRPYLRPALDNNKARIEKMIGDVIGKAAEAGGR